jgi:hypothetical protein
MPIAFGDARLTADAVGPSAEKKGAREQKTGSGDLSGGYPAVFFSISCVPAI